MKSEIAGIVYDTLDAKISGEWTNQLPSSDPNFVSEKLYQSLDGHFFIHRRKDPYPTYGTRMDILIIDGVLIPMSEQQAQEWMQIRGV